MLAPYDSCSPWGGRGEALGRAAPRDRGPGEVGGRAGVGVSPVSGTCSEQCPLARESEADLGTRLRGDHVVKAEEGEAPSL